VALPDDFDADVEEAVGDLPVACVFDGHRFTATSSENGTTRAVEVEGMIVDVDLTLCFPRSALKTLPQSDDEITAGGAGYRVLRVASHPSGIGGVELSLKATVR
jgi:hypothetical protein